MQDLELKGMVTVPPCAAINICELIRF